MGQKKRFQYQEQDSDQTLKEGLQEYYQGHPGLIQEDRVGSVSAELFHSHDRCHVIFGLDTNLVDEGLADLWTMLGTDVGVRRYVGYLKKSQEAQNVLKEVGVAQAILGSLKGVPKFIRCFFKARRQTRKLPWENLDKYLDVPLKKIREEFNIRVFS